MTIVEGWCQLSDGQIQLRCAGSDGGLTQALSECPTENGRGPLRTTNA